MAGQRAFGYILRCHTSSTYTLLPSRRKKAGDERASAMQDYSSCDLGPPSRPTCPAMALASAYYERGGVGRHGPESASIVFDPRAAGLHPRVPHYRPRASVMWSSAPVTEATCARLQSSSVTAGESGYTSVVVAYAAERVTLAQRPSVDAGTTMTPSWTSGSSMMVPLASPGAMWVTFLTDSITAAWNSGSGFSESPTR